MRDYIYYLNAGKELKVNVKELNGQIILGRFTPDYLSLTYGSPLFGSEIKTIIKEEFDDDCQRMIDCINDNYLDYRDSRDCFKVLVSAIDSHIDQYGRIIIGDLLTYTDEMCELMFSMGYSESIIKDIYPNFVYAIIVPRKEFVKDNIPNPYDLVSFWQKQTPQSNLRRFVDTARYQRLAEMRPKLKTIPKL